MATVYLLHFSRPLEHARHYIGFTRELLVDRLARHRSGHGANIVRVAIERGIMVSLARAWHDAPRFHEVRLKAMGGAGQLCPHCNPLGAYRRGRLPDDGGPRPRKNWKPERR